MYVCARTIDLLGGWTVERHHNATLAVQQRVFTIMAVRSIDRDSILGALPNEVLFVIFSFLPVYD